MTYNIEGLKKNRPGETAESSDHGSQAAGLYQHPQAIDHETGKLAEIITLYDPLFGDTQSEAVVRLGFVRIGDAPTGSIKTIIEQNKDARIYNSNTVDSDKARLDALELESLRRYKVEQEEKLTVVEEKLAVQDTEVKPATTKESK